MLNRWSGVLKFWEVHISRLDWCRSRKWAKHSYTYELPLSCMLKSAQTFIVSALFEHFRLTDGDTHRYHPLQSLIPPQDLFVICVGAMCKLCIRHTSQWECLCIYCISVCSMFRFKAPNKRCWIINALIDMEDFAFVCMYFYLYVFAVTHTWHRSKPQPTGPSGPPCSAFCSEIIPHCLVLYLPQLHSSLHPHLHRPESLRQRQQRRRSSQPGC